MPKLTPYNFVVILLRFAIIGPFAIVAGLGVHAEQIGLWLGRKLPPVDFNK